VSDAAGKPLPLPDRDSKPFWRGLREGALRVQRCSSCHALRWPPRELCNRCHGFASEWIALSGRGRIVSWVRTHRAFAPAWREEVPYDVVLVEQDEQEDLQLIGRLDGAEPVAGLRVRARFVRVDDAVTLLHWEPEDSAPVR
jgi:uncharacterized OB-fold protein